MPQPGETITEGTIVSWIAKEGDVLQEGDPVVELETEKAVFEHESPFEGKILEILYPNQSRVPVAKPIAVMEVAKEKAEQYLMLGIATEAKDSDESFASVVPSERSESRGISSQAFVPQNQKTPDHIKMAPYVRRTAYQAGLDQDVLQRLAAAHPEARVTKEAIEDYLQSKKIPVPPQAASSAKIAPVRSDVAGGFIVQPYSPIRVRIAENMAMSKAKIPHAHTGLSVDVTRLVQFRDKNKEVFKKKYGVNLNFLSLMYPAFVTAIKKYPGVNASFHEEPGKSPEIRLFNHIHLGVAVGSGAGLVIPVLKEIESKDFQKFNAELHDKIERAKNKQLKPEDYLGTTIIFNNFGYFGLNMGVQIIQYPLAATLGMGAIERKVVPIGDKIEVRDIANFFLAFDHRIIDGLEAGQFLSALKSQLENMTFDHVVL